MKAPDAHDYFPFEGKDQQWKCQVHVSWKFHALLPMPWSWGSCYTYAQHQGRSITCLEMFECQHYRHYSFAEKCSFCNCFMQFVRLKIQLFIHALSEILRVAWEPWQCLQKRPIAKIIYLMWFPCSFSQRQKTDVACHRWLWQKRLSISVYIHHIVFMCAQTVFQTDWTHVPRIVLYTSIPSIPNIIGQREPLSIGKTRHSKALNKCRDYVFSRSCPAMLSGAMYCLPSSLLICYIFK